MFTLHRAGRLCEPGGTKRATARKKVGARGTQLFSRSHPRKLHADPCVSAMATLVGVIPAPLCERAHEQTPRE
eukprot:1267368-Prymnesium_polylepis.1